MMTAFAVFCCSAFRVSLLYCSIACCACMSMAQSEIIDAFDTTSAWSLILADGVHGEIVEVDGALRLDYDFTAGSGYCVVRRAVHLPLDPNHRFGLKYRGTGPPNTLEFKLIDESGENVWWTVQRDIQFPVVWTELAMRRRHFSFAWGPSDGEPLTRVGSIEIAVTASRGGKGSLWLDDLTYEPLPTVEAQPVEPKVMLPDGSERGRADTDGSVNWSGTQGDRLELEFDDLVEFSAIELVWADGKAPESYQVGSSVDGEAFSQLTRVSDSDGGSDLIFTPETEARVVRIQIDEGDSRLESVRFSPVERFPNANTYFEALASDARRGSYPLYYAELTPWTVIGLPWHDNEALVSATGAIEPVKSGYSLEPFIVRDGVVYSWADAELDQSLADRSLPIPSVQWQLDGINLHITALATEYLGSDQVLARYQVRNTSTQPQSLSLALAARPFQVLPAAQFLNTIGGVSTAGSVEIEPGRILVDDHLFATTHLNANAVVVADANSGSLVHRLVDDSRRSESELSSAGAYPSGALLYDISLKPGELYTAVVSLPMDSKVMDTQKQERLPDFDVAYESERSRWLGLLNRTDFMLPEQAQVLEDTIRANLAYILINADGEGIRPGSRSYERSWIRDGAMTSAALIALGHHHEARAFIDWYSTFQYADGKIPCVVDFRGPDPVDENDAPGEFLFAIRNSAQAEGGFDESFARRIYPKVRATVNYIQTMRDTRLTGKYIDAEDPILRASAGLMPESISHEGYSAKPMHSYWDDFWIYRGLWDAVSIADQLGETTDRNRFKNLAESFGESLSNSVRLTAETHDIEYVPGCVEVGDFDATSTSIAFYPTRAAAVLNSKLLESTFERAWESTKHRIDGGPWDGMTPYEVRTVGTFIRLGWVDRAHQYMDWLLSLRDPAGWCQWGEIAYRERAPARFVGDMPHTWVGSGAILSIVSMFAYEEDDALMLAAGVPTDWLESPDPIGVQGLVTKFGTLNYTLQRFTSTDELLILNIHNSPMPPNGYRVDVARLMGHDRFTIEIDGQSIQTNKDGVVVLPPSTTQMIVHGRSS